MFTCVLLSSSGELTELKLSKSGGLEADELQKHAKQYFSKGPLDVESNRLAIENALKDQGMDPGTIDPKLMQHSGDIRVEIKTLAPPTSANGFIAVSMYCDANATARTSQVNQLATEIAMKCGYSTPVLGDVFISRIHDDEREEWSRLDFTLKEVQLDAQWLKLASDANKGRSMDRFSSSGTLANLTQQQQKISSEDSSAVDDDGVFTWSQSREEVEVRILIPAEYKAKDLKVVIKSQSLFVSFPTKLGSDASNPDLARIQTCPNGAELFGRVAVDGSSWSIDGTGSNRYLVITLAKGVEMLNWLTLLSK